ILTFRDELPSLFPEDEAAKALATKSFMMDEFLAREVPEFVPRRLSGRALVQGHCHQKSLAGIEGEIAILASTPGLEVEVLDAGCCGMAGAFGYDREHHEISQAIGNRVLFPAIEKSPADTIVIADGFSC